MLQWWERIPLPKGGGTELNDLIAEWFYRPPSQGEYYSGDWSMDVDFAAHVRCIPMDGVTGIAQVDCRLLSPVRDHYFIFYSVERGHLVIWGGLTYADLMALQPPGVVRLNEDLLWQPAAKTRRRGNAMVLVQEPDFFKKEDWLPLCFQFPLPQHADPDQQMTADIFDLSLDRIEWYFSNDRPPPPAGPFELACFILCATVAHAVSTKREDSLEYQVLRMNRERQLFDQRVAPFLVSEKAFLVLLFHNDRFWKTHVINNVVSPDPEDEQAFCRVLPTVTDIPTLWIRIPLWEHPSLEAAAEFPLHPGGVLHLPCYPPWLANWIWDYHVVPEAQRNFGKAPNGFQGHKNPCEGEGPFAEFFREAVKLQAKLREQAKNGGGGSSKKKKFVTNSSSNGDKPPPPPIEDMEDLFRAAPPCVTAMLTQRRFPVNMERNRLTRILMGAGVPFDTMVKLFERLNDQYIRDKPQTLDQRFSVEHTSKWWSQKDPIWCTTLINFTLNGTDVGNMGCPLVRREVPVLGPPPPAGADELTLAKYRYEVRQRCGACHTPGRPEHWKPWASPEQAMREAFRRNANQGNL